MTHWLVLDLPFLYGNLYSHDLAGYGRSLMKAIPFERNLALGNLLFGLLFFGSFELVVKKFTFLNIQEQMEL